MRRILNSYISCEVTQSACCEKTKDAFVRFAKLWFTKILVAIETEGFTKQKMMFWVNVLDTFLFHRVIKILRDGRILQISIAWCQIEAEIRSFPTMYGKGGVYVVKIGEIKVLVQKLCLKHGFFEDTNLDHLTSGWPRTHCFRGDAHFDMFPKKYG